MYLTKQLEKMKKNDCLPVPRPAMSVILMLQINEKKNIKINFLCKIDS